MLQAAKALIQADNIDITDDTEAILQAFKTKFYDTELFFDPFAGAKFANYLFRIHAEGLTTASTAEVQRRIEEAQLFIEAAHACYNRMGPRQMQLV
jgi:sulfite reductase (ferredoxin)